MDKMDKSNEPTTVKYTRRIGPNFTVDNGFRETDVLLSFSSRSLSLKFIYGTSSWTTKYITLFVENSVFPTLNPHISCTF